MSTFKYILKQTLANVLYCFGSLYWLKLFAGNKAVLYILNYHNFSKYNNYKTKRGNILETGFEENFEKQIKFFKKHFNFCTTEEFFEKKGSRGINIMLTFDDGYRDNYDIAFPVLEKYGLPAIIFVTTQAMIEQDFLLHDKIRFLIQEGLLPESYNSIAVNMYKGVDNYQSEDVDYIEGLFSRHHPGKRMMLNEEELTSLAKNGMIIGNHTHRHIALTFYPETEQSNDIKQASTIIEKITGTKPKHIAFPNGLYDPSTLEYVRSSGFDYAYTINGGSNKIMDNKYTLKRIGINASDSVSMICLKILVYQTIKKGKI